VIGASDDPPRSRSGLHGFGNIRRPPIVKMLDTKFNPAVLCPLLPPPPFPFPANFPVSPRFPSSPRPPSSSLFSMLHPYSPQLDLRADAAKVAVRLQSIQSFVASAHELRATVRNSSPAQLQAHARKVGSFPWFAQPVVVTPNGVDNRIDRGKWGKGDPRATLQITPTRLPVEH